MYYLQSRYYDPSLGRFINADALASTGQGLLGNNMFAYCGNNPVNYLDCAGLLSMPCTVSAKGYSGRTEGNDSATAHFLEGLFGAGFTSEHHNTQEVELMPSLLNWLLSVKYGTTTAYTSFSSGNSDAFLSVYAINRTDDVTLSSVGAKININEYTVNGSIGLDNISISLVQKEDDVEYAGAIIIDVTQFKVGIEGSITTPVPGIPNTTKTEYVNASLTGYTAIALILYVLSGQYFSQPGMSPSTLPAL